MNRERIVAALTPRRILVAGWLVFLLYAYPGYLQADGADELVDSRSGVFTDWHSPMMTEVWRIVGIFIGGPPGMLFLQSLLFLLGSYALLRRAPISKRAAATASICLLLFPPILAALAVVGANAQLVGFLIAATAALSSERQAWRWGGLGLAVIACGMVRGAELAALPIIVSLFRWRDTRARWQRISIAAAAWLVVVLLAAGLTWLFVDVQSERQDLELAMVDIVGTLYHADKLPDDEVRPLLAGIRLAEPNDIQAHARAVYGKELFYAASDARIFEPPATDAEREAFYAARHAFMRTYTRAYLEHRAHELYRALGFSRKKAFAAVYTSYVPVFPRDAFSTSHAARHSKLKEWLIRPVAALGWTFRPFVYLFFAIIALPIAVMRRAKISRLLLVSGILYTLALMFLSTRAIYVDSFWMIAATCVAIGLLMASRARRENVTAAVSNTRNQRS